MNIIFQKDDFRSGQEINQFSLNNKNAGSIFSFIGKVRPQKANKEITSIEVEIYEKMALIQMKKIIKNLKKKHPIIDYLVIHRYGKLLPGENIILLIVASEHRKQSFRFSEELIDWLKIKVTFWKKENFTNHSEWVEQKKSDQLVLDY